MDIRVNTKIDNSDNFLAVLWHQNVKTATLIGGSSFIDRLRSKCFAAIGVWQHKGTKLQTAFKQGINPGAVRE